MSNLSTRGFNPVVPYTPAFAAEDCPFAPYETFDIDSCPSTLVQVVRQGCYPDNSIRQEVSHEECVREIANQCVIIFILSTSQTRTFLGTGTLFQPDKIITARHVLNDVKAVDLKVGFLFFDTLQRENIIDGNITVLEDGADHELDYAILGLPSNIKRIQPASLSTDNDILGSSLLIHHPEGRPQYFSVHQSLPSAHYQLQYSSFHDTTHISSGAGYRDCKKRLFAIHTSVNASDTYAKRAALFIRTITETNPRTLLLQRANSASPRICVSYNQPLPYFSLSFLDIDESRRQEALGGTPQIRSPIGRMVLFRWANKGKATYQGQTVTVQSPKNPRLSEYDKWKVFIRKQNNAPRQWVPLTETIQTASGRIRAAIHMGHKLSAAEYWEQGAQAKIDSNPIKYGGRYQAYAIAGYLHGFRSAIGKQFMQDPNNYAFEWGSLNQSNGSGGITFTKPPPGLQWKQ